MKNCPLLEVGCELLEHDILLLKEQLENNARETKEGFQSQVVTLKTIHQQIDEVKQTLRELHQKGDTESVLEQLEGEIVKSESILQQTEGVIRALHGFNQIVQAQDRLDQMLSGMEKVSQKMVAGLPEPCKVEVAKADFAGCYTIAAQRFFALDQDEVAESGSDSKNVVLF